MVFKPLLFVRPALAWKLFRTVRAGYAPEDISIEVTNICNFSCDFCTQSSPDHFATIARHSLTLARAEILLRRLRAGGVRTNVMHWTLDGEPFVNRDFHLICGRAIGYGFTNQIFSTNGSLCSPERVRTLPRAPGVVYTLCIDFCADREYFEKYRGRPGSWERVRNNIGDIVAAPDLPHLKVLCTDISAYKFTDAKELARRRDALKRLLPASPRLQFDQRRYHNSTGYVKALNKTISARYHVCLHPWFSFVVSANGDVVACSRDLEHKTVLGNLFESDLQEIWDGDRYQQFRRGHLSGDLCGFNACSGCDMPYDPAKFTWRHMAKTALRRLQLLKS